MFFFFVVVVFYYYSQKIGLDIYYATSHEIPSPVFWQKKKKKEKNVSLSSDE